MARLIVLGASSALASEHSANTHMLLETDVRRILIDAPGDPIVRLRQAGVDPLTLTDVIITHFHPDHVSGLPNLLMGLWLLERRAPLHLYALPEVLDSIRQLMNLFGWQGWPDFYPLIEHALDAPPDQIVPVLDDAALRLEAVRVTHFVPTIGLRAHFKPEDKIWAYSCDTEPDENVVRLAARADVLFHEAAGEGPGHSSPAQAGALAQRAEVGILYLIHYNTQTGADPEAAVQEAQAALDCEVRLARDFMVLDF